MAEDSKQPLLHNYGNNAQEPNLGYGSNDSSAPPPYTNTQEAGHQQKDMEYGYNFPNAVPHPQALGYVQYQFGPPALPPPPDPVLPAGYYPPGQVLAIPVPVPRIAVETHYSIALGLCITWSICLMWPAVIFSIFALIFAQHSRKHLKKDSYDKAQSKGRTSCLCSVLSIAAATIYAVILGSAAYASILVIGGGG